MDPAEEQTGELDALEAIYASELAFYSKVLRDFDSFCHRKRRDHLQDYPEIAFRVRVTSEQDSLGEMASGSAVLIDRQRDEEIDSEAEDDPETSQVPILLSSSPSPSKP